MILSLMPYVFQKDKNRLKGVMMLLATPVNVKMYCRSIASLIFTFRMLYREWIIIAIVHCIN